MPAAFFASSRCASINRARSAASTFPPYHAGVGTFTALGTAELDALAAAFGLGAVREHRAIAAGTINSNFEIVTTGGRYFLRINEGKAEADVAWESRLVTALAAAGIATTPPLVAGDGRPYAALAGKWVSVFERSGPCRSSTLRQTITVVRRGRHATMPVIHDGSGIMGNG